MNKNLWSFIAKIALEFRLSLDNVCKLLGKDPNEENKKQIYENIKLSIKQDEDVIERHNYLFFYETANETETMSKIAYTRAVNYVKRYNKAKKDGNKEDLKKILSELNKTEKDFLVVKEKFGKTNLTDEDVAIICKYRIKRVIPRIRLCSNHNISKGNLERREAKLTDEILLKKLKTLGEFFLEFENERLRKTRK